jgi:hypothetical protein
MRMNGRLWKLFIILVASTLGCSEVFANNDGASYMAKWKGNAQAAYSITIDDNGQGDMRNVQASILEEYGIRGTFNIITGALASDPVKSQMFLDIFNRGHELASHTVTHSHLNGANIDLIWSELSESKLFIEELTGAPCITYGAAYGDLDPNIIEVAQELYTSARGVTIGINGTAEGNIWKLKTAPRPTPWGATWTNEEYLANLQQYAEDVLAVEGWGVDMWHNLTDDPNVPSSGPAVNETVLRTHLAELASDYEHRLWIAPQGQVARYYLERKETTINSYTISDHIILVDLLFDGDRRIFNEPLTIITPIPKHWLNGDLTVMQRGSLLDYTVVQDQTESRLVYDAVPGSGAIIIVSEADHTLAGDFDSDGDVDMADFAIFAAQWLDGTEK